MVHYGLLHIIHGVITIHHCGDITTIMVVAIMAVVYGEVVYGEVATGVAAFIPAEQHLLIIKPDLQEAEPMVIRADRVMLIFRQDRQEDNPAMAIPAMAVLQEVHQPAFQDQEMQKVQFLQGDHPEVKVLLQQEKAQDHREVKVQDLQEVKVRLPQENLLQGHQEKVQDQRENLILHHHLTILLRQEVVKEVPAAVAEAQAVAAAVDQADHQEEDSF